MAAPTVGNPGSNVTNAGAVAVSLPTAPPAIGDRAFCVITHRDNAVGTPTPSDTAGFGPWTQVSGSPVVQGAARLTVWTCEVESTSPTAPTVSDSGDHQQHRVFYVNHPIGTPEIHATSTSVDTTSDTTGAATSPTTTVADCAIILFGSSDTPDATNTTEMNAATNAGLTSVAMLASTWGNAVTTGLGSSRIMGKGVKASAGSISDWAYTKVTAGVKAHLVIAISPPQGPAFPSVSVVDNFNRANVQPPSANWLGSFSAGWQVVSNQLVNASGGWDGIYWNATATADQEAYFTISGLGATSSQVQLHVRRDNAADTCYYLNVVSGATTENLAVWRRVASSDTQLGADLTTLTLGIGDLLGVRVEGSSIYVYHKPSAGSWTLMMKRTDSTITAAGRIGIFSNATGWILDDFAGPTIVSGVDLASALASLSTFSGAAEVPKLLGTTLTSTSTTLGAFQSLKQLASVLASTSGTVGLIQTQRLLASLLASTSTTIGAVEAPKRLGTNLVSGSDAFGSVKVEKLLSTDLASASPIAAALSTLSSGLKVDLASISGLIGAPATAKLLVSALTSNSDTSGVLTSQRVLAALLVSTSDATGALRDQKNLAAILASSGFLNAYLIDEIESVGRQLRLLVGVGR